jgi:hypothetical protein
MWCAAPADKCGSDPYRREVVQVWPLRTFCVRVAARWSFGAGGLATALKSDGGPAETHPSRPALRIACGTKVVAMLHTPAQGATLEPTVGNSGQRICICGCGRDISHKRAGAVTYDASCRSRIHRDKARREDLSRHECRCGADRITEVDVDGDLVCVGCGRFLAHVRAPFAGFDAAAREMVTDADGRMIHRYRRRPRPPAPWRDWQPVPKAIAA